MEAFLRTKTFFFIKYFVRTGNPNYLGVIQNISFFYKIDQIWEVKVAQF